jgi:hypothetical protein
MRVIHENEAYGRLRADGFGREDSSTGASDFAWSFLLEGEQTMVVGSSAYNQP